MVDLIINQPGELVGRPNETEYVVFAEEGAAL